MNHSSNANHIAQAIFSSWMLFERSIVEKSNPVDVRSLADIRIFYTVFVCEQVWVVCCVQSFLSAFYNLDSFRFDVGLFFLSLDFVSTLAHFCARSLSITHTHTHNCVVALLLSIPRTYAKYSIQMECIMYVMEMILYIFRSHRLLNSQHWLIMCHLILSAWDNNRYACMYKLHTSIRVGSRRDVGNARIEFEFVIHFSWHHLEFYLYVYICHFFFFSFFFFVYAFFRLLFFFVSLAFHVHGRRAVFISVAKAAMMCTWQTNRWLAAGTRRIWFDWKNC